MEFFICSQSHDFISSRSVRSWNVDGKWASQWWLHTSVTEIEKIDTGATGITLHYALYINCSLLPEEGVSPRWVTLATPSPLFQKSVLTKNYILSPMSDKYKPTCRSVEGVCQSCKLSFWKPQWIITARLTQFNNRSRSAWPMKILEPTNEFEKGT